MLISKVNHIQESHQSKKLGSNIAECWNGSQKALCSHVSKIATPRKLRVDFFFWDIRKQSGTCQGLFLPGALYLRSRKNRVMMPRILLIVSSENLKSRER